MEHWVINKVFLMPEFEEVFKDYREFRKNIKPKVNKPKVKKRKAGQPPQNKKGEQR